MVNVSIDTGDLAHVAVCECGWRAVDTTKAGLWKQVAYHLKHCHGDYTAAWNARTLFRRYQ
ncbi:DUF1059 domain-containing protein [Corynebacterium poyangense]|uniref:DUF1059 domain-containing protein n=1 Tax=Corynebacterium poyangense TaxID=2684405 RepID=A0A7H0SQP8_9CORY|nr:DUF1059 domain-containing protein [Corynebacterium poyangense]